MKLKSRILLFLIINSGVFSYEGLESGTWFTEKKEFRNGMEFLQLVLHKDKFIIAKLSFNEERNWEETRIQGVLEKIDGHTEFKPEMCTVFATNRLGLRWVLIKAFDCDHLKINMTKNGQEIILQPSLGISEIAIFKNEIKQSTNSIPAIIVSGDNEKFHAWSLAIRFLRKGSKAYFRNKNIEIIETVDSTASFTASVPFEIGEKITFQNNTSYNLFE